MVDVSIKSLISMAQDYVEKANIDTDNSESINTNTELNRLLAGTGASSIEDLTESDIRQKIIERDTEKIFTTFLATENEEQAHKNYDLMRICEKTISDTYDELINSFEDIMNLTKLSVEIQHMIGNMLEEGNFGQESVDDVTKELHILQEVVLKTIQKLDEINSDYKEFTGQDFPPIVDQEQLIKYLLETLVAQGKTIENGSVPIERALSEIYIGMEQTFDALKDVDELKEQYEQQKKEDVKLMNYISDYQHQFLFEDRYDKEEKQKRSKEFLEVLIEKASPMTRNYIIKQAEMAYKPENDPTGIETVQNNSARIKRSSYKTPKEIYTLRGNNVMVSDYSGRVLRTETLNPSLHTKFFE